MRLSFIAFNLKHPALKSSKKTGAYLIHICRTSLRNRFELFRQLVLVFSVGLGELADCGRAVAVLGEEDELTDCGGVVKVDAFVLAETLSSHAT